MTTAQSTAPASPPPATASTFIPARTAAVGALGFAGGVIVQNAFLLVGMPDASAPATEAATWLSDNRARVHASSMLVGLNLPLLLLFAASLRSLVRASYAARFWVDLGTLAAVVLAALFGVVAATQMAAALVADGGATPVFTTLWSLHNAAFAVVSTALGVTLLGFSIGARAARITSAWQQGLGILGAALLLVAGLASMAVAGGSPIVYVGFLGFACWLAWLVTTGVRLLR